MKLKWQDIFKYFVYLDQMMGFNKFTNDKVDLTSSYGFKTNEASKYKLRFNKYLYYLEILYTIKYNEIIFGTKKFCAFEKGVVFYTAQKNLQKNALNISNIEEIIKNLDPKIKKICNGITVYFGTLSDEELVDINHDDPLWNKAWNKRIKLAENSGKSVVDVKSQDILGKLLEDEEILAHYQWVYSDVLEQVELVSENVPF